MSIHPLIIPNAARAALTAWRWFRHARRLALVHAVDDALERALSKPWAQRGAAFEFPPAPPPPEVPTAGGSV